MEISIRSQNAPKAASKVRAGKWQQARRSRRRRLEGKVSSGKELADMPAKPATLFALLVESFDFVLHVSEF